MSSSSIYESNCIQDVFMPRLQVVGTLVGFSLLALFLSPLFLLFSPCIVCCVCKPWKKKKKKRKKSASQPDSSASS